MEIFFCVRKTYSQKEDKILWKVVFFFVCQLMPYLWCKKQGNISLLELSWKFFLIITIHIILYANWFTANLNPSLCELLYNFISMIGLRVLLEIKTFSSFFYFIDFFKKLGFQRENKSAVDEFFLNLNTTDDFIKKRFDYKEQISKKR